MEELPLGCVTPSRCFFWNDGWSWPASQVLWTMGCVCLLFQQHVDSEWSERRSPDCCAKHVAYFLGSVWGVSVSTPGLCFLIFIRDDWILMVVISICLNFSTVRLLLTIPWRSPGSPDQMNYIVVQMTTDSQLLVTQGVSA